MSTSTLQVEGLIFGREYYWIPATNPKTNGNGRRRQRETVRVESIHLSRKWGSTAVLMQSDGQRFVYNPKHSGGRLIQKKQLAKAG